MSLRDGHHSVDAPFSRSIGSHAFGSIDRSKTGLSNRSIDWGPGVPRRQPRVMSIDRGGPRARSHDPTPPAEFAYVSCLTRGLAPSNAYTQASLSPPPRGVRRKRRFPTNHQHTPPTHHLLPRAREPCGSSAPSPSSSWPPPRRPPSGSAAQTAATRATTPPRPLSPLTAAAASTRLTTAWTGTSWPWIDRLG